MCSFVGGESSFLKLGSVLAGFKVVAMSNFYFELNKANYCEFCLASFSGLILWFVFSLIHAQKLFFQSQSMQKIDKKFASSTYLIMGGKRQNNPFNLVPQLKENLHLFQKAPPTIWPHHQHTCRSKWKIYVWTCYGSTFQSTGQSKSHSQASPI